MINHDSNISLGCFPNSVAFSLTAAPLTSPQTSQTLEVNNDRQTKNCLSCWQSFFIPKRYCQFLGWLLELLGLQPHLFYFWEVQEIAVWNEWPFSSFILKKTMKMTMLIHFSINFSIFPSSIQTKRKVNGIFSLKVFWVTSSTDFFR